MSGAGYQDTRNLCCDAIEPNQFKRPDHELYLKLKSMLTEHPDIQSNLTSIVDKYQLPVRSSDRIKEEGVEYLFQELEGRRIINCEIGGYSTLKIMVDFIKIDREFCLSNLTSDCIYYEYLL